MASALKVPLMPPPPAPASGQLKQQASLFNSMTSHIVLGVSALIVILIGVGLGIGTLVVNQNLASNARICIYATGNVSSAVMIGELDIKTSDETLAYRMQFSGLSSALTQLQIHGPISPGQTRSTAIAVTLCGMPCLACDTVTVANQVSGKFHEKCLGDSSLSLGNVIKTIREQQSTYYIQANTGMHDSGDGEVIGFLLGICTMPV